MKIHNHLLKSQFRTIPFLLLCGAWLLALKVLPPLALIEPVVWAYPSKGDVLGQGPEKSLSATPNAPHLAEVHVWLPRCARVPLIPRCRYTCYNVSRGSLVQSYVGPRTANHYVHKRSLTITCNAIAETWETTKTMEGIVPLFPTESFVAD